MKHSLVNRFYQSWLKQVELERDELMSIWRKPKDFTEKVIRQENGILMNIAKDLQLECYNVDYYCLDSVFYLNENVINNNANSFYLKQIEIAFEHENFFNENLFREVGHLLITNCKLRVLVTYPNDNEETIMERIREEIDSVEIRSELERNAGFLIILGYENQFQWKGYLYHSKEWISL
ncbi:MAG: hypothetical protein H6600_03705 [Flavobacteriales bacterium]|nr:hypothetical protein [Flavobacteriales bacterium]